MSQETTSQKTAYAAAPAEPQLTGVRNFRDVGGLPTVDGRRIRHGRLYRSGHLAHATPEDTEFLRGLGLHTIFDFRNSSDIALEGPDVELPGVRNLAALELTATGPAGTGPSVTTAIDPGGAPAIFDLTTP